MRYQNKIVVNYNNFYRKNAPREANRFTDLQCLLSTGHKHRIVFRGFACES